MTNKKTKNNEPTSIEIAEMLKQSKKLNDLCKGMQLNFTKKYKISISLDKIDSIIKEYSKTTCKVDVARTIHTRKRQFSWGNRNDKAVYEAFTNENFNKENGLLLKYVETKFEEEVDWERVKKELDEANKSNKKRYNYQHSRVAQILEGNYNYVFWSSEKNRFLTKAVFSFTLENSSKKENINTFNVQLDRIDREILKGKAKLSKDGFLQFTVFLNEEYCQCGFVQIPINLNPKIEILIISIFGVYAKDNYSQVAVLVKQVDGKPNEKNIKTVTEHKEFWEEAKRTSYTINYTKYGYKTKDLKKEAIQMKNTSYWENFIPKNSLDDYIARQLDGTYQLLLTSSTGEIIENASINLVRDGNKFEVTYNPNNGKSVLSGFGFLSNDSSLFIIFWNKDSGDVYYFGNFKVWKRTSQDRLEYLLGMFSGTYEMHPEFTIALLIKSEFWNRKEEILSKTDFWEKAKSKYLEIRMNSSQNILEKLSADLIYDIETSNTKRNYNITSHNFTGTYTLYSRHTSTESCQVSFSKSQATIWKTNGKFFCAVSGESRAIHEGIIESFGDSYQILSKRKFNGIHKDEPFSLFTFEIKNLGKEVDLFVGMYSGPLIDKAIVGFATLIEVWKKTSDTAIPIEELCIGTIIKYQDKEINEIEIDIRRFLLLNGSPLLLPTINTSSSSINLVSLNKHIPSFLIGDYNVYYPTPIKRRDWNNMSEDEKKELRYSIAYLKICDDGYSQLMGKDMNKEDFEYIGVARTVLNGYYIELLNSQGNYTTISIYYENKSVKYISGLAVGLERTNNYTAFPILLINCKNVQTMSETLLEKLMKFHFEKSNVNSHFRSFRSDLEKLFLESV